MTNTTFTQAVLELVDIPLFTEQVLSYLKSSMVAMTL